MDNSKAYGQHAWSMYLYITPFSYIVQISCNLSQDMADATCRTAAQVTTHDALHTLLHTPPTPPTLLLRWTDAVGVLLATAADTPAQRAALVAGVLGDGMVVGGGGDDAGVTAIATTENATGILAVLCALLLHVDSRAVLTGQVCGPHGNLDAVLHAACGVGMDDHAPQATRCVLILLVVLCHARLFVQHDKQQRTVQQRPPPPHQHPTPHPPTYTYTYTDSWQHAVWDCTPVSTVMHQCTTYNTSYTYCTIAPPVPPMIQYMVLGTIIAAAVVVVGIPRVIGIPLTKPRVGKKLKSSPRRKKNNVRRKRGSHYML